MSKYKITKSKAIKTKNAWFSSLLVEIDSNIGKIQILNLHLRPALSRTGVSFKALFNNAQIHQQELNEILAKVYKITKRKPHFIVGDFNENEQGQAFLNLLNQGYKDALSLFDDYSETWQWSLFLGLKLRDRYDHILVNLEFICIDAKVTQLKASDHFPVIAVIKNN